MDRKKDRLSKKPAQQDAHEHQVQFELESDAEALFRQALEDMTPDAKPRTEPPFRIQSKKTRALIHEVDLHGHSLEEARHKVDAVISELRRTARGQPVSVRIITGKGKHSGPDGGILVRLIYDHVKTQFHPFIKRIDAPPSEAELGGVPLRGHFDVTLLFP